MKAIVISFSLIAVRKGAFEHRDGRRLLQTSRRAIRLPRHSPEPLPNDRSLCRCLSPQSRPFEGKSPAFEGQSPTFAHLSPWWAPGGHASSHAWDEAWRWAAHRGTKHGPGRPTVGSGAAFLTSLTFPPPITLNKSNCHLFSPDCRS